MSHQHLRRGLCQRLVAKVEKTLGTTKRFLIKSKKSFWICGKVCIFVEKIIFLIMDYTKVPRELIWADRNNIDDFFVDDSGSLDNIMFERIGRSMICNWSNAAEYVLEMYNNAYYITTLILMEKHPILYFSSYNDISMSEEVFIQILNNDPKGNEQPILKYGNETGLFSAIDRAYVWLKKAQKK